MSELRLTAVVPLADARPPHWRPTASPVVSLSPRVVAIASVRATKAAPRRTPVALVPRRTTLGTGQWGLINQDRAANGLPPLQWSSCLANIATGQARRMAAQGYISHAGGRILDLSCHLGSHTGENIGFTSPSIDDAGMNAWFMGDAPHRANILGPYHYVGVAWVQGANRTWYLAVEFG